MQKRGYLPTLDGWRALAILAVIFHHDSLHVIGRLSTSWLYEYGGTGVDIFFAISGILICSRLLDEESLLGSISLKRFYIRRAFRILPPALCYLFVLAGLAQVSRVTLSLREFLSASLFCRNYPSLFGIANTGTTYYTNHFWSLAVEEHFYFLLPALLIFTSKALRPWVVGALASVVFVHRLIAVQSQVWVGIHFHTDVRLDALLVPSLFAILASDAGWRQNLTRYLRFWPVLAFGLVLLLPIGNNKAWFASVVVLVMPMIVLGSVLNPTNVLGRLLEFAPLRFIGRISYSLYLWQQLFFIEHFGPKILALGIAQTWPIRLVLTFSCAIASYYILERPLTRVGHRLAPSATRGREDLVPTGPVAA